MAFVGEFDENSAKIRVSMIENILNGGDTHRSMICSGLGTPSVTAGRAKVNPDPRWRLLPLNFDTNKSTEAIAK